MVVIANGRSLTSIGVIAKAAISALSDERLRKGIEDGLLQQ